MTDNRNMQRSSTAFYHAKTVKASKYNFRIQKLFTKQRRNVLEHVNKHTERKKESQEMKKERNAYLCGTELDSRIN